MFPSASLAVMVRALAAPAVCVAPPVIEKVVAISGCTVIAGDVAVNAPAAVMVGLSPELVSVNPLTIAMPLANGWLAGAGSVKGVPFGELCAVVDHVIVSAIILLATLV